MKNKSRDAKRLAIFILLAFSLAWIPWIIMNSVYGFESWFSGERSGECMWLMLLSGGSPAIANVLTRLITGEGLKDEMLRLKLKGNMKIYLAAVAVPAALSVVSSVLVTAFLGDIHGKSALDGTDAAAALLQAAPLSMLMAFNTFGEEYGWRGYMNGKLEALTNRPLTIIAGGIIWGVWHAPLTVEGHNFGTDYAGFPWLGIVMMSVFCCFSGMFLMWLTVKSGSIYPAAIAHAVNNNFGVFVHSVLVRGIPADPSAVSFKDNVLLSAPTLIVYLIFGVLLLRPASRRTASTDTGQE